MWYCPYGANDPRPWKIYRPHRRYAGAYYGSCATQHEAMTVAARWARSTARRQLAEMGIEVDA